MTDQELKDLVASLAKAQGLFVLKHKGEQLNIQTDGMKGF